MHLRSQKRGTWQRHKSLRPRVLLALVVGGSAAIGCRRHKSHYYRGQATPSCSTLNLTQVSSRQFLMQNRSSTACHRHQDGGTSERLDAFFVHALPIPKT